MKAALMEGLEVGVQGEEWLTVEDHGDTIDDDIPLKLGPASDLPPIPEEDCPEGYETPSAAEEPPSGLASTDGVKDWLAGESEGPS